MFALRTFAARGRAARCDFSAAVAGAYQYINTYTGTNTATLGTHQAGDVLVAIAARDGSATAPSIPAGQGWGSALSTSGANSLSYVLVGKIAAGASEGVGTFTSATSVAVVHLRPGTGITPAFGATATSLSGSTVNLSIPALTGMSFTDGSSTVLGFYMHISTNISDISVPPSGMTLCAAVQDATDTLAVYRSSSQVSSWSAHSVSFTGTSSAARTVSLELCWPSPNDSTPNAFSFPSQPSVALSTVITSQTITLSGTNVDAAISVSGGEYSVNGGAFTSSSGTISPNSTIAVRHTSSASNSTNTVTTLTIGGVQGTFTSTTIASSTGTLLFFDDFSSGDLSRTQNGFAWADSAKTAVVSGNNYLGDTNSLRFRYDALPVNIEGNTAEQRFSIGRNVTEFSLHYYILLPGNFVHRPGNNKGLATVWANGYADYDTFYGVEFWPTASGSEMSFHPIIGDLDYGHDHLGGTTHWANADVGKWHQFRMYAKVASPWNGNNGIVRIWKYVSGGSPTMVFEKTDIPGSSVANYFNNGYILGWANSGYAAETDFLVKRFSFMENGLIDWGSF